MSGELNTLVAVTRELAGVTTIEGLRAAVQGPLKPLLPSRQVCVLRASHGSWEAVIGAEDAVERIHQFSWTPLVSDGKTIGMLGLGMADQAQPSMPVAEAATTLLSLTAQNIIALENMRQQSMRDGLTGCFNRAHALEVLEGNMRRANRTGFPVSIFMMDIDDFKQTNDGYGHVAGDAVLAAIGAQLHGMLRLSDVRCRLGGDEFLIILPDTPLEDAQRVAESVRHSLETLVIATARGPHRITVSIGVATATCGGVVDVSAFIDRADVALYGAKQAGRNCVHAAAAPAGSAAARRPLRTMPRTSGSPKTHLTLMRHA